MILEIGHLFIYKKCRKFSGQLVLMYGAWYGLGRGFIELLRTDSLMLGAFKVSSLLSFLLCAVCAVLLVYFHKQSLAKVREADYGDQFAEQMIIQEQPMEDSTDIEEVSDDNDIEETASNEQID